MRPVSDFVSAWTSSSSAIASTVKPGRKRKRSRHDRVEDDADADHVDYALDTRGDSRLRRSEVSDAEAQKNQFYVAGYSRHAPRPNWPFPHGETQSSRKSLRPADVQRDLASLNPPLPYPPNQADGKTSSQQQHLAVITNIMHTSLLKGDYIRAGRAWGLLLRSVYLGRHIDPRVNGHWGVGAEILLRRGGIVGDHTDMVSREEHASAEQPKISGDAFKQAKDYYEQLILQYPYQKQYPHSINALTFYPAMFSLYIFEAVESSKRAIARIQDAADQSDDAQDDTRVDDFYNNDQSPPISGQRAQRDEIADVKRHEFGSAKQIATRVDELMLSPPFDSHGPILQLRAMVALWIADLCEDLAKSRASDDDEDSDSPGGLDKYARWQDIDSLRASAVKERDRAHGLLSKVQQNGCRPARQVQDSLKV